MRVTSKIVFYSRPDTDIHEDMKSCGRSVSTFALKGRGYILEVGHSAREYVCLSVCPSARI